MSYRIEKLEDGAATIIQISGNLKGDGPEVLERLCRETTGSLSLEISDLRTAESHGVELINKLVSEGVKLIGTTRYLELLLDH